MDRYNINASDFQFEPGAQIELYFFDEKFEYRFEISERTNNGYNDCVIVNLPHNRINDFYKGEDFIQCRCVHKIVVYEFTGEILKIIRDDNPCVIIKPAQKIKEFNHRKKSRISVEIVAEYNIESGVPGLDNGLCRGFVMIKDASMDGISFQTTDTIPINAVIKMNLFKEGIILKVQVMKVQMVNEKSFYGSRIVDIDEDTKLKYQKMLEKLLNADKMETIY